MHEPIQAHERVDLTQNTREDALALAQAREDMLHHRLVLCGVKYGSRHVAAT